MRAQRERHSNSLDDPHCHRSKMLVPSAISKRHCNARRRRLKLSTCMPSTSSLRPQYSFQSLLMLQHFPDARQTHRPGLIKGSRDDFGHLVGLLVPRLVHVLFHPPHWLKEEPHVQGDRSILWLATREGDLVLKERWGGEVRVALPHPEDVIRFRTGNLCGGSHQEITLAPQRHGQVQSGSDPVDVQATFEAVSAIVLHLGCPKVPSVFHGDAEKVAHALELLAAVRCGGQDLQILDDPRPHDRVHLPECLRKGHDVPRGSSGGATAAEAGHKDVLLRSQRRSRVPVPLDEGCRLARLVRALHTELLLEPLHVEIRCGERRFRKQVLDDVMVQLAPKQAEGKAVSRMRGEGGLPVPIAVLGAPVDAAESESV
mmetsp:Transcript_4118/g.8446  ORF Transcript_4118/g.8446 Transcript_4118/m.8446 type:complete len:372 (-) Transcript_4118:501-1616(-)